MTAREVIRKYLKKVRPLYEKLSQKGFSPVTVKTERSVKEITEVGVKNNGRKETCGGGGGGGGNSNSGFLAHSFSGNLRYPRRKRCASSCPSSMRSSPSHSGVLSRNGWPVGGGGGDTSSMEELQNAIQGAIAHCKNSLNQNKTLVSNEI